MMSAPLSHPPLSRPRATGVALKMIAVSALLLVGPHTVRAFGSRTLKRTLASYSRSGLPSQATILGGSIQQIVLFQDDECTRQHRNFLSGISPTALFARSRGLEIGTGGATPSEGGMTLYLKAGPDGTSVGDCPFSHFVRMVLEEKGLDYQLRPCGSNDDKPEWLKDHYDGKMPALRHRSECYVESDVIAQYLDYFFQPDSLLTKKKIMTEANEVLDGFFPAFAKYSKHTPDGDAEDEELEAVLLTKLGEIEARLGSDGRTGPWFVGDGEQFTLTDCSLAPKLYHMTTCLAEFKGNSIDVTSDFPRLSTYCEALFSRPSFEKTVYPKEHVTWGWGNARM